MIGSEQGIVRPVLIIQNDTGSCHSHTVIAAAVNSRANKNPLSAHAAIREAECGLRRNEVLWLKWGAIHFKDKMVSINHKIIEVETDGKFVPLGEDVLETKSCGTTRTPRNLGNFYAADGG